TDGRGGSAVQPCAEIDDLEAVLRRQLPQAGQLGVLAYGVPAEVRRREHDEPSTGTPHALVQRQERPYDPRPVVVRDAGVVGDHDLRQQLVQVRTDEQEVV